MYATANDFILRVGELQAIELTDRNMRGEVNRAVLEMALADSSSQIDGYLAARYRLPLPSIPQNLTRLCCDLARYRLASMSSVAITDEIIERYKLSLKELEWLASGKMSLGLDEATTAEDNSEFSGAVFFTNHNNRVFRRDNQD